MTSEKIHNEIVKIKSMDKDKRLSYFKTYYLKTCVVIFICLILFVWFLHDTFFQKQAVCNGCIYGIEISDEIKEKLTDGYLDYFNYNEKKYSAAVATDNLFEGTAQQMDANSHEMALFAQIAAGEIHYLILDKENLEAMSNGGVFANLNEILDVNTYDSIKAAVVELKDDNTNEVYKAAIDLKKIGVWEEYDEDVFLVYTISSPYKGFAEKFLEYLLVEFK